MQQLTHRLLLTAAAPPIGAAPPEEPSLLALRLSKLIANGWVSEAATLAAHGYQLMLAQSQYHPQSEAGLVDAFLGRRVDAIVLTGRTHPKPMRDALKAQGVPVVEIWDLPRNPIDMAAGFSHTALGADRERRQRDQARNGIVARYATLTPREREIMALAARGLMNKQIAGEVGTSEITVKIHRGNAMRKMEAKTFADLVRMAEALGLA